MTASAAKIDRRFSRRFPKRQFWLRPATPSERNMVRAQHGDAPAITPAVCMAIGKRGPDYIAVPFWCSSADVADATEGAAAEGVALAVEAIKAGTIARIMTMRTGR